MKDQPDVFKAPDRNEFEAYADAIGTLAQPEWLGDVTDEQTVEREKRPIVSIREALDAGHKNEIRTTYEIQVDGEPFRGHAAVNDEGHVHCHAIPYKSFGSAIEFVKRLIDLYPESFQEGSRGKEANRDS